LESSIKRLGTHCPKEMYDLFLDKLDLPGKKDVALSKRRQQTGADFKQKPVRIGLRQRVQELTESLVEARKENELLRLEVRELKEEPEKLRDEINRWRKQSFVLDTTGLTFGDEDENT